MRPNVYKSQPRRSYPVRLLRALLSAIIPGLGQLVAGVWRRAIFPLAVFVAVTGAAVYVYTRGYDAILTWAVQPKVLLALIWVDAAILLVRLYAVVDAWLAAKGGAEKAPPSSTARRTFAGLGLALILLFTVAPHAAAGYYTFIYRDALTSVFAGETSTTQVASGTTATLSGSLSTATTATTAGTTTSGSAGSTTVPTTAPSTTTSNTDFSDWGSQGRMTILLIGTDAGYARTGARSDSMNVATIDLKTGQVAMFGLPRNTGNTPLGPKTAAALKGNGLVKTVNGKKVWGDLLNSLYTAASTHPELAPNGDPGAEAVRETASLILGIPIDYYAVVNMMGLVDMVDAVGGVSVKIPKTLHITYAPLNAGESKKSYVFNAGVNHLDGLQALAFARDRADSDDYVRMGRQRCVIMAMLYQNSVGRLTLRFPMIASALKKSVKTDIPVDRLPDLLKVRGKVEAGSMITVGFAPPDWTSGYSNGMNVLDTSKIHEAVRTILTAPDRWVAQHPAVVTEGSTVSSACWTLK